MRRRPPPDPQGACSRRAVHGGGDRELVDCCNAAVLNALLENSACTFTREQLEDLWGAVDDAVLEQTARQVPREAV